MLSKQLSEQMTKWQAIVSTDIPAYNNLVRQQEVPALKLTQPDVSK